MTRKISPKLLDELYMTIIEFIIINQKLTPEEMRDQMDLYFFTVNFKLFTMHEIIKSGIFTIEQYILMENIYKSNNIQLFPEESYFTSCWWSVGFNKLKYPPCDEIFYDLNNHICKIIKTGLFICKYDIICM